MRVSVFGAGYVGLVTSVCLAKIGHDVLCIDNNAEKINLLQQGIPPIYEQGLEPLLQAQLEHKTLRFSTHAVEAIRHGDVLMIAVGTPVGPHNDIDLRYVYEVIDQIAAYLDHRAIIVMKSTVPPGTADRITARLAHTHIIDVASNPEFLQEGTAIQQFMSPDRVIIGADHIQAIQMVYDLYAPIINAQHPCLIMDKTSAELSKYASNTLLATKISFINEMSQIAEHVGADIRLVKRALGLDHRINPAFLNAGCGFGGSCFPKDVLTLIATAIKHGINPLLMRATMERNQSQQAVLFHKVSRFFNHDLKGKIIALWGLTFKPHTDDIRCATSHVVADLFWKSGCTIQAYDPMGMEHFAKQYSGHALLRCCPSAVAALEHADVLVITTEWPEFSTIPLQTIKNHLRFQAVFDGRNIIQPREAVQHHIHYEGIGCAPVRRHT